MRFLTSILGATVLMGIASCTDNTAAPTSPQNTAKPAAQNTAYSGPTFESTQAAAAERIKVQMDMPITIPVPKDPGGGYTHETHKANSTLIYEAGQLYKLTGETQYADYAGKLLLAYAEVYPDWPLHPAKKEQSPGRMFWQNLNESMFLLNVAKLRRDQRHFDPRAAR